jgi:hypothetical protein
MTPNDRRPDIPYSGRLAADSAQARLDPLNSQPLVPQILSRAVQPARSPPGPYPDALACRSSQPIPSLTPPLNPHRASRTAGALPTAISCLGAFRTPAASACADDRHRRRPKTCTFSDSCTATMVPIACMIGDLALSCQIASSQEN